MLMIPCLKELLIGFFVGFIMQLFPFGGTPCGDLPIFSWRRMAKLYDPQSNDSMPVSGSIFNLFITVAFFAGNGHLTFMRILFYSFDVLPPGPVLLGSRAWEYAAMLLADILILALKLALPVVAIEIIAEMGLGILMRAVPQINVFVVGLQLKLLVGLILIVAVFPGIFGYFDFVIDRMFQGVAAGLQQLAGPL